MKEGKYTGKVKNLTEPGDENENKMMTIKVEYDEGDSGEKGEPQQQKCVKLMPNTDTNDILCSSCTSASRNNNNINNNGTKTVTNTETNSVTIEDEGNNGEVAEAKAEAEAATNSIKSHSSKNGIGRSNSKSNNCMDTKILKRPDENENKKRGNNVGHNGDNPSKTRESQQQKCENGMSIASVFCCFP